MKRLVSLLLCGLMLLSMTACGGTSSSENGQPSGTSTDDPFADGPSYTLKLGHVQATTHPYHIGAEAFKSKVEELTEGKVTVDIYPNSQLGGEIDMIESAQMGNLDLVIAGTCNLTNFDPSFGIFDLPFLFENREHALAVCESEYGTEKLEKLKEFGLVGLGYFDNGFFDVMNNKRDVVKPSDLKGLNIRIVQNPIYAAAFTACGANPVPMAPAEVYTALQNGTVDGNCLSINGIYGFGWYELQNTYMIANMFFCALPLVMSKTVFDGMPEAYQQAIMEAGAYACEANHTSSEEQEATNLAIMQEAGIKVTYPEDINEWISLMQDEVYPQFTDTIPEEEIEQVRAMAPA